MTKTKIEWTDYTWNPVWGCNAGCDYCYARNIAKRFAYPIAEKETGIKTYSDIPAIPELERNRLAYKIEDFEPVWLQKQFDNIKFPKKTSRIFVGSMSDIAFWEDEWVEKVAEKIKEYPQHTFLLLTKFPKVYKKLDKFMPKNVWFGVSITRNNEMNKLKWLYRYSSFGLRKLFISFEPLLEDIKDPKIFKDFGNKNDLLYQKIISEYSGIELADWIIVGAMSGNNNPKTKIEWIENIVKKARKYSVPVFVKQIEINGKIEKDVSKFPKELQYREFPMA